MLNKVVLVGRLTRDPELRYTPGEGIPVVNFGLAVERPFTNRQGEREADFLNIVAWRRQAENCASYLGKGSLIALDGRIQSRSYEDKEGKRRMFVEVVADNVRFLDSPRDRGTAPSSGAVNGTEESKEEAESMASSSDSSLSQEEDLDFSDDFDLGGEEHKVKDEDVPF